MNYPFNSAQFLNDAVFTSLGGVTGTTSAYLRQAAYFIAEKEMCSHLGTLLQPTNLTGTYLWATAMPVNLDFGYVQSINSVAVLTLLNIWVFFSPADIQTAVYIRDPKRGIVDVSLNPMLIRSSAATPYSYLPPYNVTIGYTAGLPTGTTMQFDVQWALVMAAQLVLNEMDNSGFLANETPGGIGVQEFTNELYSEKRVVLGHSIFGSSPVAQQITRIVENLRAKRALRLH